MLKQKGKTSSYYKAQGEVEASRNLAEAANNMSKVPGAIHLRTLSTINDISGDASNTIVFTLPIEVLRAVDGFSSNFNEQKENKKK